MHQIDITRTRFYGAPQANRATTHIDCNPYSHPARQKLSSVSQEERGLWEELAGQWSQPHRGTDTILCSPAESKTHLPAAKLPSVQRLESKKSQERDKGLSLVTKPGDPVQTKLVA